MKNQKKVTLFLPEDLLQRAQSASKKGITETIREGLQLVASSKAYEALLKLRGKVKVSINLNDLREDRR